MPALWWWNILFIVITISFAIEVGFLVNKRKTKYIFGSAILLYALLLLGWVVFFNGSQFYLIRTGLFTAVLIIALLSLHIIDLISDEKK